MFRNVHIWLPGYLYRKIKNYTGKSVEGEVHVIFCLCDHFEPLWNNASFETGLRRIERYIDIYPKIAEIYKDSKGNRPKITLFYPAEEYQPEYLNLLADFCAKGYGEVEIHIHHDNDKSESLQKKLLGFKDGLVSRHSLLSKDKQTGEVKYGFIHGNWALDNSRKDGRFCGVNDELQILQDTGCYADFTLPSAPSDTQTRKVNSIYYAVSNPYKPKSHNWGRDAMVGVERQRGLLVIQGPLCLNWKSRKFGIFPRIENSEVAYNYPPSEHRVNLWLNCRISINGRPNCIFIKTHTHGLQDRNSDALMNGLLEDLFASVKKVVEAKKYILHYFTAREIYNALMAFEDGLVGDPGDFRDYILCQNLPMKG